MRDLAPLAAALGVLLSTPGRADAPPPELGPCWRRSAGEACVLEVRPGERRPGRCVLTPSSQTVPFRRADGTVEAREERDERMLCQPAEPAAAPPPAARAARKVVPWAVAAAFALLLLRLRRRRAS
jgi:hypothetical protein